MLTKGRPVFANMIVRNGCGPLVLDGGFYVGWDKWSDGHVVFDMPWTRPS